MCVAITIAVFASRWFGNKGVVPIYNPARRLKVAIVGECALYLIVYAGKSGDDRVSLGILES